MAEAESLLKDHVTAVIYLLENLGFIINHPKSELSPTQEIEFQLHCNGAETARQEDQKRSRQSPTSLHGVSPYAVPHNWENECSNTGDPCGSTILQTPPPRGSTGVCLYGYTNKGGQRGAGVVERPLHTVERNLIAHNSSLTIETDASKKGWGAVCNGVRTGGPWSPHEQTMHINCLELLAAHLAVKCFAKNKANNPSEDGQHVSTDIYQQTGGNDLPTAELPSQRDVAVVYGEEHPSQGTTPARCTEYHSRRRVKSHERPVRLDAVPRHFPPDQQEAGPSGGGPVRQQANPPTPNVCKLETRPIGRDHRCVHNELGRTESIRQSPMEPHWEGTGTDTPTTSRACNSGTGMEGTGMVPSATGDASTHTIPDTSEEGSDPSHTPGEPPRGNPPTSRVGYLRQCYKDYQISEEATKLLLASWRHKSSKSYDSLFGKWASWCSERHSDPVSCPTSKSTNFKRGI